MQFLSRFHLRPATVRSMPHIDPIGVVRLSVQSAHIIQWSKLLGGAPDPFVGISINGEAELARTRHQTHDFEPTWMETKYVVVHSVDDILDFRLYDHHDHRRHFLLGEAHLEISEMKGQLESYHLPLMKGEKQRGEVLVNVAYYATVEVQEVPKFSSGVVTLTILAARRLDASHSRHGVLSSVARVRLGPDEGPVCETRRLNNTNDPVWELWHDFYCPNNSTCIISVKIVDESLEEASVVGELLLSLDDLIEGNKAGVEWWPLSGCGSGDLEMRAEWRGVVIE